MVVVETYTKLISDAINTHFPNSSYNNHQNHHPSIHVATDDSDTAAVTKTAANCFYLSESASASSSHGSVGIGSVGAGIGMHAGAPIDDRSRLLVILRWIVRHVKVVYHLYMEKYMTHPIALALIPLLVGLGVGVAVGYSYSHCYNGLLPMEHVDDEEEDDEDEEDSELDLDLNSETSSLYEEEEGDEVIISSETENESELFSNNHQNNNEGEHILNDNQRDAKTRSYLKSKIHTTRQSTIPLEYLPKHIAVIMDGNRRYGKSKYNSISRGHWDGSKTLIDFGKWCIAEHIQVLTVYAFSTENWNRSQGEISALMKIFCKYCDELRVEAKKRGICVRVLSTETDQIPADVAQGIQKMVHETKDNTKLIMNICLSYGSRGEITNACQSILNDIQNGTISQNHIKITESMLSQRMLTGHSPDPDLVIRTSGEYRLSNFLLWQLAYAEMFFVEKNWPEMTKKDLIRIIRSYAIDRKRRYGK